MHRGANAVLLYRNIRVESLVHFTSVSSSTALSRFYTRSLLVSLTCPLGLADNKSLLLFARRLRVVLVWLLKMYSPQSLYVWKQPGAGWCIRRSAMIMILPPTCVAMSQSRVTQLQSFLISGRFVVVSSVCSTSFQKRCSSKSMAFLRWRVLVPPLQTPRLSVNCQLGFCQKFITRFGHIKNSCCKCC